jgi:hypothetical protein
LSVSAAIDVVLYVGVLPAVTALVAYFTLAFTLPREIGARYAAGGAFALGVFASFATLPSTRSVIPSQYWEWIPYFGLLAALVAGLAGAHGVSRGERIVTTLLTCILGAWFFVPTWPDLEPSRSAYVATVATGMFLLAVLLEPLPARLPGRLFPWWLMCAAGTGSLIMMVELSETFGRLSGLPAAALAGCGVAMLVTKSAVAGRSLALPYAVVVGGYAFAGSIYPSPPLWLLLIVPVVPLMLWVSVVGPIARLAGKKALAAQAACVLVPLIVLMAIVFAAGSSGAGDDW